MHKFQQTAEEWRSVFIMLATVISTGGLLFVIFASGEVQKWALVDDIDSEKEILCPNGNVKRYHDESLGRYGIIPQYFDDIDKDSDVEQYHDDLK